MSRIPDTQPSTLEMARSLGLSSAEFNHICKRLDRVPTYAELGVFSAMFSEHCSYKSSRRFFKRFPTTGKRVLQGPGENAGILDIGHGWAVAFKMESHNHPSYIEPFQGAATGVGGILRDIFTMGARPIAAMNALCFGTTDFERTKAVARGVVKGIGDYGNCFGVPTVAGQTTFQECYNRNPLVNAFALGLLKKEEIFRGTAKGIGNFVVYAGAKTGRDGVHGATMASKEFSTGEEPERPTVQVGDPFTEKLLLEATLEVMRGKLVVGIQDMGAAGLTSSSFEMADRAGTGLEIDLDRVPTREKGLSGYELLLSESQERMLMVCTPENFPALQAVYEKWDLHAEQIGTVVANKKVVMRKDGKVVVDLPVDSVAHPPEPERPKMTPSDLRQRWFIDRNRMLQESLSAKLQTLFDDIHFADPSPIVHQYDSMVGNRTEGGAFDDAAVLRLREIEGKKLRLALTSDCNPRVCWLSPREGGRRAVAEAAMNLAVRGADPLGITDCLNFGSPENPEVMWQFEECIEGISEACESLQIPVISGNVSFYNDTDGKPVFPTPMIGMVGLIEETERLPRAQIYSSNLELALVGPAEGGLGGSLLASAWFKRACGQPEDTDLAILGRAIKFCQRMRKKRFAYLLHDISDGGLVTAALETAFRSELPHLGVELQVPQGLDVDLVLFGETVPRLLVAYDPDERTDIETTATQAGVAFHVVGHVNETGVFSVLQGRAKVFETPFETLKAKWRAKWTPIFAG